ncbi:hypothetical protein [Pseudomonas sp. M30-35]|uniref:hypothetical protein n=1 Tax=Pseudomonas sp. M30-35 TaxID=1981174 RepID=UPI000B3D287F|nr:hypothetical protein [Pseudomonas sp. M30-35]ARU88922.1 hypothetical protein B9K09_13515 [Pseudomonas sp. M30-35]
MNKQPIIWATLFSLSAELSVAQPASIQGVLQFHGSLVERTCGLSPQQMSRWPGTLESGWSERCAGRDGIRTVTFTTQGTTGSNDFAVVRQLWPGGVVVLAHE